ncbi:MAG TPA: OmpA family protein [Vicinamibacterales bacterium]|nr:OmpA family protein [Vicinamibacterales bacterium]
MLSGATVRKLGFVFLLALFIPAACGKKPPEIAKPPAATTAPPTQPPPPPPPPPSQPPPVQPPSDNRPVVATDATDYKTNPTAWVEKYIEDVFFDLDASELSDRARTSLSKNAEYMKKDYASTARFSIEGHADARGTSEYNLALGDRRAAAVRDYMVSLGIAAARLTAVSLGEERPVCTEENEVCWAKNRRGHFVLAK